MEETMKALQFGVNMKGVYSYGRTVWQGKDRHVFDIALELMEQQRIKTESLVTHYFKLDEYCRMIKANINKKASQAMKTAV
jgi:threonine dehydrogenase-like Zn-dependent dehydrogenase